MRSHPYMGSFTVTSPSGVTIELTEAEEKEALREAAQQKIISKIGQKDRVVDATITALGSAVGLAIGGYFIAKIIGKRS